MEKEYKYMVGVSCMTYNQSKYILDALNGFVMQQTNFPYVVMVVDDASTDGEQEVIRKFVSEQFDSNDTSVAYEKETDYANITYAQHKTNKNCYIAVLYLKENHYSQRKSKMPYLAEWRNYVKYIALCEGDDYWIDAQKLQKQVDFLEENGEYSMCFHKADIKIEEGVNLKKDSRVNLYKNLEVREYTGAEILRHWTIPTASAVYRNGINIIRDSRFIYGDSPLFLSCAECGKIYCVSNESLSVYRLVPGSAVATKRHWRKYIDYYKAIEENYTNTDVKKIAKKLVLNYYISSFIGGRLGRQSFDVAKEIVRKDRQCVVKFLSLLPIEIAITIINKLRYIN
ncbi:MAG: glycosyltransferase [Bacteroidales bacterium]|nr:glycosyltransferase [Bacteroidales bacterium]